MRPAAKPLVEYAKATYEDDAELRNVTAQAQADFVLHGAEYFAQFFAA